MESSNCSNTLSLNKTKSTLKAEPFVSKVSYTRALSHSILPNNDLCRVTDADLSSYLKNSDDELDNTLTAIRAERGSYDNRSYVTEEEIEASLARKEESNFKSSTLSECSAAGSISSQISAISKGNSFDDQSLNARRNRQNELINSIKSQLDSSCYSVTSTEDPTDDHVNEMTTFKSAAVDDPDFGNDEFSYENTFRRVNSIIRTTFSSEMVSSVANGYGQSRNTRKPLFNVSSSTLIDENPNSVESAGDLEPYTFNVSASTVLDDDADAGESFHQTVPPAVILKQSFSMSETSHMSKRNEDELNHTQYEEAFASLHEILYSSGNILDLYHSKLETYKAENDKKFEQMFSKIVDGKRTLSLAADADPIGELGDQINSITTGDTLIAYVSSIDDGSVSVHEETLVPPPPLPPSSSSSSPPPPPPPWLKIPETVADAIEKNDGGHATAAATAGLLEEKDPENLMLGGGGDEAAADDFDEDLLLASDEEQDMKSAPKSAVKEAAKNLEFYVSEDPEENRDNNDPKWDYLRNLGNDYERYMAVRARWKNLEIPNPKRDLTCRCRNVNRSSYANKNEWPYKNEFGKRVHSSPDLVDWRSAKRPRKESCTMLYDMSIQQLIRDVENEQRAVADEQEQQLKALADQQEMDQMRGQRERKNNLFFRQMKNRHYMEVENLMKDFQHRRDVLTRSATLKMEALRKAGDEVRQFHEFYPNENAENGSNDRNALIYLTETEVQEILEVENMLIRFETFYSPS